MISLRLLGDFQIAFNTVDVTTKLSKKGRGLLIYMACHPQKLFYRDQLASIFWADHRKDSALNNLRYCLWQIRRIYRETVGDENLFTNEGKHAIKINVQSIDSDYTRFVQDAKDGNHSHAVTLYQSDFLEGFYIEDVPEFSDWVFNEREQLQRMYFDLQLGLAKNYAQNNNLHQATKALNQLIDIDPLNETVYYYLIQYQALSGNKVTAINTYRNLKQQLRDELNISPSDDIQKLYNTIIKNVENSNVTSPIILNRTEADDKKFMTLYVSSTPEQLNRYAQNLSKYENLSDQLVLDLCDSPGLRVNYEGLFEILDDLHVHGKYKLKRYQTEFAPMVSSIKNNQVSEDLYLFNQFEALLHGELSNHQIFRIWNLHFLDSKTIDFLSYIFRKKSSKRLTIMGIYDIGWQNMRLDDFIKANKFGENVRIINDYETNE